jgi:hypothetical protein
MKEDSFNTQTCLGQQLQASLQDLREKIHKVPKMDSSAS